MAAVKALDGELTKKDKDVFGQVVACYEKKDYIRGVKIADGLLKKYPNHGETQAMKGLLRNCQGKREEAFELCKLGLRNNMRSHICWHVYGLVYRSENNYKEASKCYLNALRWFADNQNILRDLSWLQVHLRDFAGFVQTREKILKSKPSLRTSWVGASLANFMAGNYGKAFDLVNKSKDAMANEPPAAAYETSELLLFQNSCLEKDGKLEEALEHLQEISPKVVDKLAVRIKEAQMQVLVGRYEDAQRNWLALVVEQPENYRFHCGLQTAYLKLDAQRSIEMFALRQLDLPSTRLALTDDQRAILLELYRSEKFKANKKIEIGLAPRASADYKEMLEAHMKKCLRDGVPALFHDVCMQITQPDPNDPSVMIRVRDAVDFRAHPIAILALELVSGYCSSLRATGTFGGSPAEPGTKDETPTALLWSMFLHAHLLECCGNFSLALTLIDECIAHTPTAPDMLLKKAKILKKSGDLARAAETCDAGRALDLQDRYLNNKATKYFLRADAVPQAVQTISMFTKNEGDPQQYLASMQCNWFELEAADAFARTKQWGLALKKLHSVQAHFVEYVEDMFDFHGFCLRKTSLRAHADAVQMQDNVFAHKFYQRACRGALRIYLHLLDEPEDIDGLGHLSKEDRKKEKARRKKLKLKETKAAEEEAKAAEEEAKWMGGASVSAAKDEDPVGEKFLAKNFLEEAQLWCARLSSRLPACEPETLAIYVDVQIRRGKSVQAARALLCGLKKSPGHPALTVALVKFAQRVVGFSTSTGAGSNIATKETVKAVVSDELYSLLQGKPLEAFVSEFVASARADSSDLPRRVAAVRCLLALRGSNITAAQRDEAGAILDGDALWAGRGITVVAASEALKVIRSELQLEALGNAFRERFLGVFPLSLLVTKELAEAAKEAPYGSYEDQPDPSASEGGSA